MTSIENILAKQYNYKKLSDTLSSTAQSLYIKTLPLFILLDPQALYTSYGTLICSSYDTIVIGDYGAYIEFSSEQANKGSFMVASGQEYRLEERYKNCKYIWLTTKDDSGVKIYYQKHPVSYADYKVGKYYISVREVYTEDILKLCEDSKNENH